MEPIYSNLTGKFYTPLPPMEPIYSNVTGGSIFKVLESIGLSFIEDSYMCCSFDKPRKCDKRIYPLSERFICNKSKNIVFEVLQYHVYHFKIKNNLLKVYDCNTREKIYYSILLTDNELITFQKILPIYKSTINYCNPDF